jgi:large subunit ribosomal protein L29
MATTSAALMRTSTEEDLERQLREAKEELFNLRFQAATGQLESHGRLRTVRRDIARIYTILRERELGIIGFIEPEVVEPEPEPEPEPETDEADAEEPKAKKSTAKKATKKSATKKTTAKKSTAKKAAKADAAETDSADDDAPATEDGDDK